MQACGVLDPRGSRQIDMPACPLGSLLAGIKDTEKKGAFGAEMRNRRCTR